MSSRRLYKREIKFLVSRLEDFGVTAKDIRMTPKVGATIDGVDVVVWLRARLAALPPHVPCASGEAVLEKYGDERDRQRLAEIH